MGDTKTAGEDCVADGEPPYPGPVCVSVPYTALGLAVTGAGLASTTPLVAPEYAGAA